MAVDEHEDLREIIRKIIIRPAEREIAHMIVLEAVKKMLSDRANAQQSRPT